MIQKSLERVCVLLLLIFSILPTTRLNATTTTLSLSITEGTLTISAPTSFTFSSF
ncbi:hypothetical protein KBC03_07275 [Patescibacteria group bacterium]|nr:hypothetical protein [Patescibacteria group bacterium]